MRNTRRAASSALRETPSAGTTRPEASPAIYCRNLGKHFDVVDGGTYWRVLFGLHASHNQVAALQQITLEVPKGKIVGVIGRNGAGKSTLLRTLAGVYTPTAGEFRVVGEAAGLFELGGHNSRFMTGREYATQYLSLRVASRRELEELIDEIRAFSELGDFFERRIHTYSTGMAARLYFAAATLRRHEVYLIDEILSVGDEHFQAKCWARMRDRLRGGASGLLVTHDWSAAIRLCESCYVLDAGRIVESGSPEEVVPKYLNLPRPATDRACFAKDLPQEIQGVAGEDWQYQFMVEAPGDVDLEFAFSIERLIPGLEWEIIVLSKPSPVGRGPGRFRVNLTVPELPLPAGDYHLNLFLSEAPHGMGESINSSGLDTRGWTYGNGIRLRVSGTPHCGRIAADFNWHVHA